MSKGKGAMLEKGLPLDVDYYLKQMRKPISTLLQFHLDIDAYFDRLLSPVLTISPNEDDEKDSEEEEDSDVEEEDKKEGEDTDGKENLDVDL